MNRKRRVFIGVVFSESEKNQIEKIQIELARKLHLNPESFISKEKMHLTLHFLGAVTEEKIEQLKLKLPIYSHLQSFSFELSQVLAFPSNHHPRVIAVAGSHGNSPLSYLYSQIKMGLGELDLPTEERLFVPHVTLFRPKNSFQPLQSFSISPIKIQVQQFALLESELKPTGSAYQVLQQLSLN